MHSTDPVPGWRSPAYSRYPSSDPPGNPWHLPAFPSARPVPSVHRLTSSCRRRYPSVRRPAPACCLPASAPIPAAASSHHSADPQHPQKHHWSLPGSSRSTHRSYPDSDPQRWNSPQFQCQRYWSHPPAVPDRGSACPRQTAKSPEYPYPHRMPPDIRKPSYPC